MISRWFQEYKNFDEDMKEEYIHCYLSEERKYLVLDYEKFREAVKAVSLSAGELKKIYPNDPCPCGSGKKYKKCCGRK